MQKKKAVVRERKMKKAREPEVEGMQREEGWRCKGIGCRRAALPSKAVAGPVTRTPAPPIHPRARPRAHPPCTICISTVATILAKPYSSSSSTAYVIMLNMPSWMICWIDTLLAVPVRTLICTARSSGYGGSTGGAFGKH